MHNSEFQCKKHNQKMYTPHIDKLLQANLGIKYDDDVILNCKRVDLTKMS